MQAVRLPALERMPDSRNVTRTARHNGASASAVNPGLGSGCSRQFQPRTAETAPCSMPDDSGLYRECFSKVFGLPQHVYGEKHSHEMSEVRFLGFYLRLKG